MSSTGHLDFNDDFLRAMELIDSGSNIFITGKAGTGKSTLLRHFLSSTQRKVVVVAPTGVAALNVGGQTIHRLFNFPASVTADLPNEPRYYPGRNGRVLKSLEVLVVDEVSMVRADLLDAMEAALRRFGPSPGEPFGGVQMVFVGDPYQLPPVVMDAEEAHFRSRYSTPYFFSSDAVRRLIFEIVQLEKVYRQRDDAFVALLNSIRTGEATQGDFDRLNERYLPAFEPPDDEFWITLTTTNLMAQRVNEHKLEALDGTLLTHQAVAWGDIDDADKPVGDSLAYKVGAQVMLLTNDPGNRWVNGSLGVVAASLVADGKTVVTIELVDAGTVDVQAHTWEVTRPVVTDGRLSYDVVGSFTQLPFKLAWAVTIHKSQGATLDRVVVSLGRGTFADGQLYVALSRCTSLPGLVLKSEVKAHHVKVEREVTRFLARSTAAAAEAEGYAFVGVLTTGVSRFDRVIEIGVVIDRDGQITEHSTLLNPMRDIGDSAERYQIAASDVSMAPTFAEAWPWLARRMDGCVIVAHGLPLVQTMMEREVELSGLRVDLGLGVDTHEHVKRDLPQAAEATGFNVSPNAGALDRARATAAVFRWIGDVGDITSPYRPQEEGLMPGRILSRDEIDNHDTRNLNGALAYSDHVAFILNPLLDIDEAQTRLQQAAFALGVSPDIVVEVHQRSLAAIVQAAARDGNTSEVERSHIEYAASVLMLSAPSLHAAPAAPSIEASLQPGARVCFTGTVLDPQGASVSKEELHWLADDAGLVAVTSVSKTKCDVLIAADASSMSSKAKKAREFGKPVYSASEFYSWLSRT
ncbi:MAG: AAA family ATPase [bacterium]|nr:AAA family ATPase [bacterium]